MSTVLYNLGIGRTEAIPSWPEGPFTWRDYPTLYSAVRPQIEHLKGYAKTVGKLREGCMSTDIWNLKPRKIKQDTCHGSHGEVLITREVEETKQVACQKCGRKFHVTAADLRGHGLKWKRLPSHPPKKNKG